MTTFAIGGSAVHEPNWSKSKHEPASLEYQYLNGSLVYIGGPTLTLFWDYLPDVEVAALRMVYDTLVAGVDPLTGSGTYISVTIPDRKNGGFRTTTAYMTEPKGEAGGDGSKNFSLTLYNLHEATALAAIASPLANYWDEVNSGANVDIGTAGYRPTSWQY